VPKFDSLDPTTKPITAHIDIDDDPLEDILFHLSFACDWIDAVILPNATVDDGEDTKPKSDGVLVHCTQGISRSGAFVTAYCKS
jgi:dual specificity phosphatase 12